MLVTSMLQAGVSHADIVSLRAVRNSPVRNAPMYQKIRERIRLQLAAYEVERVRNSYVCAD